ncbi:MAG: hypothetical protein AB1831_07710 [Pseudomonadota bacterium]
MSRTILPIDQVEPGMVLASDLHDARGAVMLAAGTHLGESHLAALRRRGVRQAEIEVHETLSAAEREARRRDTLARLSHLFRGMGDGGEINDLYQSILEYRLEQLE